MLAKIHIAIWRRQIAHANAVGAELEDICMEAIKRKRAAHKRRPFEIP